MSKITKTKQEYFKNYYDKNKVKLTKYKAEYHKKSQEIGEVVLTLHNMNTKLKQICNGHRVKDKKKGIYDEENFIDRQ